MKGPVRFLVLSLLLLSACVEDSVVNAPPGEGSVDFTIEEARNFFESQTERNLQGTRADGSLQQSNPFNPGDFTPVWDKAKTSQSRERASVDIPILSSYRFRALQSSFNHGRSKVDAVNISQKLVVVKDLTTGRLGSYILTLIPDSSCGAKDVDWSSRFLNSGDKGKFSGLALYTESSLGLLIRVSQYREGRKINGVYIPGPKSAHQAKMLRVQSMLSDLRIGRAASHATRSWGEDDYNWYYTDIGGGFFSDDQGHIFYDSDGDGTPDSIWIPEVTINPDPGQNPDPDPDPDPEPNPDPDPDPDPWPDPIQDDPGEGTCPKCGANPCSCNKGTENSQLAQKIFNFTNSNLTQAQIEKVDLIVNKIAQNKVGKYLCESLISRVKIRYDPNLPSNINAKYDPNSKTISVKDLDRKNISRTMVEELVHALQDQFYPGGIKAYGHRNGAPNPPGHCNIEFEAHMIKLLYDVTKNVKESDSEGVWSTRIQGDLEVIVAFGTCDDGHVVLGNFIYDGLYFQDYYLSDFCKGIPHYASESLPDFKMQVFDSFLNAIFK